MRFWLEERWEAATAESFASTPMGVEEKEAPAEDVERSRCRRCSGPGADDDGVWEKGASTCTAAPAPERDERLDDADDDAPLLLAVVKVEGDAVELRRDDGRDDPGVWSPSSPSTLPSLPGAGREGAVSPTTAASDDTSRETG